MTKTQARIMEPNLGAVLPISLPSQTSKTILWKALSDLDQNQVPNAWYDWLSDRGSLTARLIDASENQFSVEVLRQHESVPSASEAAALKIATIRQSLLDRLFCVAKVNLGCLQGASCHCPL